MIYGSSSTRHPVLPEPGHSITVGGLGIGMNRRPLTVSAIAGVGIDEIGPVSAIALMLQSLGAGRAAVIQAVIPRARCIWAVPPARCAT